jgi:predicted DCC family thiol-disulfide oxidoreductase YuxK
LNEAKVLESSKNGDVLLIDGHCGMCSKLGNFLSKRVSNKTPLDIIAQEGDSGVSIVSSLAEEIQNIDSVILIRNGRPYYYSSAGIRCLLYMKWWWKIIYPFAWLVPLPIRNFVYKIIAKNRHKISRN